jgi:hypothetical protein
MTIERVEVETSDEPAPAWLHELIREVHVPRDFRDRCRLAASSAHGVATMRKEHERNAFTPLSFGAYIRGLAEITGVSLRPVLSWLNLRDVDEVTSQTADALSRLGREMGLSLSQLKLLFRIAVGERLGYAAIPVRVFRRGVATQTQVEVSACSAILDELESHYPLHAREEIREISRIADGMYGS